MPKRFKTKIVEIDAIRWTNDAESFEELYDWAGTNFTTAVIPATGNRNPEFTAAIFDFLHDTWIAVKTGQWIVQGAKGEFYPCDDETFHWKYEEVVRRPVATKPAKCPYEGKHQGTVCFSDGDTCRHCGWTL